MNVGTRQYMKRKVMEEAAQDGSLKESEIDTSAADQVETQTVLLSSFMADPEVKERTVKKLKETAADTWKYRSEEAPIQASKNPRLPPEMWAKIFSHLDDSKEVVAIINSYRAFSHLLSSVKTKRLFDLTFPHIFSKLDQKDILKCREVCPQWREAIDNFLQNHGWDEVTVPYCSKTSPQIGLKPPHYPSYKVNLVRKNFLGTRLDSNMKVKTMTTEMEEHPRNPLVLRRVFFEDSGSPNYWNHVFRFVYKYGQHIWHATLFTEEIRDRPCYFFNYNVLHQILTCMPNLRTFCVCGFHSIMDSMGDDHGDDVVEEQFHYLASFIDAHPLPDMPHLHTIEDLMSGAFYREPLLKALMIKYSSQLIKFTTPMCSWGYALSHTPNLQQMTELSLKVNENCANWRQIFETVSAPNLTKLRLNVWMTCDMSQVLTPLQHNFPALVYLTMILRQPLTRSRAPPRFLLQKVKTLEILDTCHVSYDQLLSYFPAMDYLMILHSSSEEQICLHDNDLEIRKCMYSESMYHSNIWVKKGSLKEVIIGKLGNPDDNSECEIMSMKRYFREEYENRAGQKNTT